jgi:hypothetical protein
MAKVLVFIEHAHGKLLKSSLVAIHAGQEAAKKAGGDVAAVVLGSGVDAIASEVAGFGVAQVLQVDDARLKDYVADIYAKTIAHIAKDKGATVVIAAATAAGKDFFPRVAQLLDAGMASDITAFNEDGTITRPTYAGKRDGDGQHRDPGQGRDGAHHRVRAGREGGQRRGREGRAPGRRHEQDALRLVRRDQERSSGARRRAHRRVRRTRPQVGRELHHRASSRWSTRSAPRWARRAPRSTPASCPTICRSARPARSSRRSSTSRSASRARSSTSPA